MNIKISFDHMQYSSKPTRSGEIAEISNRIGRQSRNITPDNIHHYIEDIGQNGQTFCPATFTNGIRKKDHFEQMKLFVLDFDGGITYEEVCNRAEQYDLPILFAYETLSSINKNKFRIAFLNDISITNIKAAEIMLSALATIFPEVDPCVKNANQMYFGGKKLLYFDDDLSTINIESIIRNMTLYLQDKYGLTHYKEHILAFAKANNIALTKKKMLDISVEYETDNSGDFACEWDLDFSEKGDGKNSPNSIILYKAFGENLPKTKYIINLDDNPTRKITNNLSVKKCTKNRTSYRSNVLNKFSDFCKLYRELENGERRLHHDETFGIATNLSNVESGDKRFLEMLDRHKDLGYYENKSENYWRNQFRFLKQNGYKPKSCDNFCPYKGDCPHGADILSTVKPKYREMQKISNYEEVFHPIEEVESDVENNFVAAIEANIQRVLYEKRQVLILVAVKLHNFYY